MIDAKPTEYLGELIARWDAFYASNFEMIFKATRSVLQSREESLKLTERIFLNLLLSSPELILLNDEELIWKRISAHFPEMKEVIQNGYHSLKAIDLLPIYYSPN